MRARCEVIASASGTESTERSRGDFFSCLPKPSGPVDAVGSTPTRWARWTRARASRSPCPRVANCLGLRLIVAVWRSWGGLSNSAVGDFGWRWPIGVTASKGSTGQGIAHVIPVWEMLLVLPCRQFPDVLLALLAEEGGGS